MHFLMNMLYSEPKMYSRVRDANTTNYTKEEKTTNRHTNVLSHKKTTLIEIPRTHAPTKNKIPENKKPKTITHNSEDKNLNEEENYNNKASANK